MKSDGEGGGGGGGGMNEVEALQYRNSWLVFFFVSLCLSRRRRSPSVSKTIAGRRRHWSETNGPPAEVDLAPVEEWIEIALKI